MLKAAVMFITFEGIDGCGKTTQIRLLSPYLAALGIEIVTARDPGTTTISERIRELLLDRSGGEMATWTELLLYEAARAQLVEEVIRPSLAAGRAVLCDRFYDSTTAYQGYGRGLDLQRVHQANRLGSCGLCPDLTFVIDVDPEVAAKRKALQGGVADRIEAAGRDFQRRVRQGYLTMCREEPVRLRLIDGNGSADEVQQRIREVLNAAAWLRRKENDER